MSLGRRAALAGLALLVAGLSSCSATSCPDAGRGVPSNDCVGALEFGDRTYVVQYLGRRIPSSLVGKPAGVAGRTLPCDDNPAADCDRGNLPRAVPATALRIRGIPADEALLQGSDRSGRKSLLVPADPSYAPVISARVQRLIDRVGQLPGSRGGPVAAQESARR